MEKTVSAFAVDLGISRQRLHQIMKRYNINPQSVQIANGYKIYTLNKHTQQLIKATRRG